MSEKQLDLYIENEEKRTMGMTKQHLIFSLEYLKELNINSAEKDFCEHNIKKAIKWLEKINGNGNR